MSSFSCHTGRYSSTVGDVIVFKVEPDGDDDRTIKTESEYPISVGGLTQKTSLTHQTRAVSQYSRSTRYVPSQQTRTPLSTFSDNPMSTASTPSTSSAPTAVSTIPVNENHDDDNYNILLRRKNDLPQHPNTLPNVQTGNFRVNLLILNSHLVPESVLKVSPRPLPNDNAAQKLEWDEFVKELHRTKELVDRVPRSASHRLLDLACQKMSAADRDEFRRLGNELLVRISKKTFITKGVRPRH